MDIKEKIKPFTLCEHEDSASLLLDVGDYKNNIFEERSDEGFEGNGYDWASLATVFLEEKVNHLSKYIEFDPEGSMFCVYSENKQAIIEFAIAFHEMCEDDELMRELFSRAELD